MIKKILLTLAVIPLCAAAAYGADESNFSLRLSGGMAALNRADNMSGESGNAVITSLYDRPRLKSRVHPVLMFDARYYDDARKNEYYFDPARAEHGAMAVGVKHKYEKGSVDLAAFFGFLGRVWENPYVLARTATQSAHYGFDLRTNNLVADGLSLSYKAAFTSIDNDTAGDANRDLKRDGSSHKIHAGYKIKAAEGVAIEPGFSYERAYYSGRANRYNSYGVDIGARLRFDGRMLMARLSASENIYDAVHPVFNKKREETNYGASLMYVILKPFGWEKWHASVGAAHNRTEANLVFFDRQNTMVFAVLGYTFGRQRGPEDGARM